MRNFFYRVSSAMARFMYGRNGSDQFNMALLLVYLAVWVLQLFLGRFQTARMILEVIALVLILVVFFRMFSKNLPKRRAENTKFLNWWYPIKNRSAAARQRKLDKDHKYFTCKNCKTVCRVPSGKGKVEITCPKCGQKIIGRS